MASFPFPPYHIKSITEFLGSEKIELYLNNGFKIIAFKHQFDNYEYFKKAVAKHAKERLEARKRRP